MIEFIAAVYVSIVLLFANTHVVFFDPGGVMSERIEEIEMLKQNGTKVIIAGECFSACTMYAMPEFELDVCMTPDALFGYHQPYADDIKTEEDLAIVLAMGQAMFNSYHPIVQKYLSENYWPSVINGDDESDLLYMNAYDMEGVIPFCGGKDS